MTLQDAKNAIAVKHGRPDWFSLVLDTKDSYRIMSLFEEAALLYGENKWDEGWNACIDTVSLVMTDKDNLVKMGGINIPAVDIFEKFGEHLKSMLRPKSK